MQPPPEIQREVFEVGQTHLLNRFTDQLFDLITTQYLDQLSYEAIETDQAHNKSKKLARKLSAISYGRHVLRLSSKIEQLKLTDLCSEDFILHTAIQLGEKAYQQAKAFLKQDPDFVQACCGWSDRPKQIIPLKPSQIQLAYAATKALLLTESQEFNLLACLGISAISQKITQVDAQFILQLEMELLFEDLPITFLQVRAEQDFVTFPKLSDSRRTYLAVSIDCENQWIILHGYDHRPQSQQAPICQLKPAHQPLVTLLSQICNDSQSNLFTPQIETELEDLEEMEASELFDDADPIQDLEDPSDSDGDPPEDSN